MAPEPERPERPIEKLLRACAKKKREQAGEAWEPHPATRRLLQQEAARRWRSKPASTSAWFGWLLGHGWLRPLVALGAVASIAIVTWVSLQTPAARTPLRLLVKNEPRQSQSATGPTATAASSEQVRLKRNDAENREEDATQLLADNNARKKQETASTQQSELAKDLSKTLDRPAAPAQPPTPAQNGPVVQEPGLSQENVATLAAAASAPTPQNYHLHRGLQSAHTAPATAPVPELATVGAAKSALLSGAPNASAVPLEATAEAERRVSNLGGVLRDAAPNTGVVQYGYFAASQQPVGNANARSFQTLAQNQKAPAAPQAAAIRGAGPSANQILVSFRLEQAGRQLRVIDSDGSVYAGPIQASNGLSPAAAAADQTRLGVTQRAAPTLARTAGARDSIANGQPPVHYFFQVVGTNRSSNQQVIFSGTLNGDTNLLGTVSGGIVQANEASDKLAATPPPSSLQTLRLSGKVVIGQDPAVQLEAVPASPPPPPP